MADEADVGNEYMEKWLSAQLAEHTYQLNHAVSAYPVGECRNCQTKLDDGRAYCDKDCADDFAERQRMSKRRGR